MKIKEFIRLFVPPIYYRVKHAICDPKAPIIHPLSKIEHENDKMVIIGNGPSLNRTMELYGDRLKNYDCVMVNFSARTPLYEQIKPKYYIIADPGFIENSALKSSIDAFVHDLYQKTTWPMTIIMPDFIQKWDGCEIIKQNSNITILYYNNCYADVPSDTLFQVLDDNLIGPPAQTVLNTAVWLAIYWGYKETYLVGADTSFLEDTHVDQTDNRTYTEDKHFYSNTDVYAEKQLWAKNRRYLPVKYHEEIETIYIILKSYWDMKRYAEWKGVKVYNASEYSCIDAFERKKIN